MNKSEQRKQILDKMKRTNRMFESEYNQLNKELELESELEKQYKSKRDQLKELLFEKEKLQRKLELLM